MRQVPVWQRYMIPGRVAGRETQRQAVKPRQVQQVAGAAVAGRWCSDLGPRWQASVQAGQAGIQRAEEGGQPRCAGSRQVAGSAGRRTSQALQAQTAVKRTPRSRQCRSRQNSPSEAKCRYCAK